MTRLIRIAAALALGLYATVAVAAGGTTTTSSTQPKSSVSTQKKKVKPKSRTASGDKQKKTASISGSVKKKKRSKPAEPAKVAETVDLWAGKFGDLGPAYVSALKLAQAGKYEDAIAAFNALGKPDDPRVLNWIGFSLRKQGKVDEAMPYYQKALGIAPDFTPAHEYMGEAYLQLKQVDKAKEQLGQIEKLCGNKTCEEYAELSEAIAKTSL